MYQRMRHQKEFLKLFSSETRVLARQVLFNDSVMIHLENRLVQQLVSFIKFRVQADIKIKLN
jgi:hypothetical protein